MAATVTILSQGWAAGPASRSIARTGNTSATRRIVSKTSFTGPQKAPAPAKNNVIVTAAITSATRATQLAQLEMR